jgi:hypothetical protein
VDLDDLPIKGLEPLAPLLAYLIVYLLGLVLLRLFLWPLITTLLFRRGPLLARTASLLLARLAAAGLVLGAAVWSLAALGLDELFYDLLEDTPDLDLATIAPIFLFFLFLFALVYFFVIRPVWNHFRPSK